MAKAAYYGTKPSEVLTGTATLDFGSIAAVTGLELTITVAGAAAGDAVALAPPATMTAGLVWSGRVSAANTVTVRVSNITAGALDPASATWGAAVFSI